MKQSKRRLYRKHRPERRSRLLRGVERLAIRLPMAGDFGFHSLDFLTDDPTHGFEVSPDQTHLLAAQDIATFGTTANTLLQFTPNLTPIADVDVAFDPVLNDMAFEDTLLQEAFAFSFELDSSEALVHNSGSLVADSASFGGDWLFAEALDDFDLFAPATDPSNSDQFTTFSEAEYESLQPVFATTSEVYLPFEHTGFFDADVSLQPTVDSFADMGATDAQQVLSVDVVDSGTVFDFDFAFDFANETTALEDVGFGEVTIGDAEFVDAEFFSDAFTSDETLFLSSINESLSPPIDSLFFHQPVDIIESMLTQDLAQVDLPSNSFVASEIPLAISFDVTDTSRALENVSSSLPAESVFMRERAGGNSIPSITGPSSTTDGDAIQNFTVTPADQIPRLVGPTSSITEIKSIQQAKSTQQAIIAGRIGERPSLTILGNRVESTGDSFGIESQPNRPGDINFVELNSNQQAPITPNFDTRTLTTEAVSTDSVSFAEHNRISDRMRYLGNEIVRQSLFPTPFAVKHDSDAVKRTAQPITGRHSIATSITDWQRTTMADQNRVSGDPFAGVSPLFGAPMGRFNAISVFDLDLNWESDEDANDHANAWTRLDTGYPITVITLACVGIFVATKRITNHENGEPQDQFFASPKYLNETLQAVRLLGC